MDALCADRNSRWHQYEGMEPHVDLDKLLREVNRDPTGYILGLILEAA